MGPVCVVHRHHIASECEQGMHECGVHSYLPPPAKHGANGALYVVRRHLGVHPRSACTFPALPPTPLARAPHCVHTPRTATPDCMQTSYPAQRTTVVNTSRTACTHPALRAHTPSTPRPTQRAHTPQCMECMHPVPRTHTPRCADPALRAHTHTALLRACPLRTCGQSHSSPSPSRRAVGL